MATLRDKGMTEDEAMSELLKLTEGVRLLWIHPLEIARWDQPTGRKCHCAPIRPTAGVKNSVFRSIIDGTEAYSAALHVWAT